MTPQTVLVTAVRLSRRWAAKHQWVAWSALILSLAAVVARYVFVQGGDVTLGVAMAAAALAGCIIAVVLARHDFDVDAASDIGPLSMPAGLVFSAPGD